MKITFFYLLAFFILSPIFLPQNIAQGEDVEGQNNLAAKKYNLENFPDQVTTLNETLFLIEELISSPSGNEDRALDVWNDTFYSQLSKEYQANALVEWPLQSHHYVSLNYLLEKLSIEIYTKASKKKQKEIKEYALARLNKQNQENDSRQGQWIYHALAFSPLAFRLRAREFSNAFESSHFHYAIELIEKEMYFQKLLHYQDVTLKELEILKENTQKYLDTIKNQVQKAQNILPHELLKKCQTMHEKSEVGKCLDSLKVSFVSPGINLDGRVYFLITRNSHDDNIEKFVIPGLSYPSEWEFYRNDTLSLVALSSYNGELLCQKDISLRHFGQDFPFEERFFPYHLVRKGSQINFSSEYFVAGLSSQTCSINYITLIDSPQFGDFEKSLQTDMIDSLKQALTKTFDIKYFALDQALILINQGHPKGEEIKSWVTKEIPQFSDWRVDPMNATAMNNKEYYQKFNYVWRSPQARALIGAITSDLVNLGPLNQADKLDSLSPTSAFINTRYDILYDIINYSRPLGKIERHLLRPLLDLNSDTNQSYDFKRLQILLRSTLKE